MKLYKETVSDLLWMILDKLMKLDCLSKFRLVGGTSLSLLIGHRSSIDIDLFTDSEYGSIDFLAILDDLKCEFPIVHHNSWSNNSIGNSCFIGYLPNESIKLDLFYTDPFIYPIIHFNHFRLSRAEDIIAMKLDIIGQGGRKKDFWDLHALLNQFSLQNMIEIYSKRYPYNFNQEVLISKLTNFEYADNDPDPICFLGKYWELIKLDFELLTKKYR